MSKTFSQVLMAAACVAALLFAVPARAQKLNGPITLVAVGDTNNAADSTVMVTDSTSGYGSVAANYSISAFDITITQYASFLNAIGATDPYGCWNATMASGNPNVGGISRSGAFGGYTYAVIGTGSNPVTNVTWLDAARFCNWLQNGQPVTGVEGEFTTETGAYTLDGDTTSGMETKNTSPPAEYWIPEENEWYKAAFYDPTIGGTGGYWTFPTLSNTAPGNDFLTPTVPNQANYIANGLYSVTQSSAYSATQNYLTPVGSFTNSSSHYGTFDQGGDVYNWNDAIISGTARGVRGGGWDQGVNTLQSNDRESRPPTFLSPDLGFRVATTLSPVPVISSALSATGTAGVGFSYTITAYNNPTNYFASGLPNGLVGPSSIGVISGTPSATGTFPVIITGSNAIGAGSATLELVIVPYPTPTISSSLTATGTADLPFSYTIEATANPSSFGAAGLPPGLVVTTTNGLISGSPTQTGTFSSTISAINSTGTGTAMLSIDIGPPPAPMISSTLNVTGTEGTPFGYQIEATFGPTSFTSGTLPGGLTLDGSTGLISGTPTQNGTFSADISASNLGGTGTDALTITLLPPIPVITSAAVTATNGAPFIYQVVTTGTPSSYGATGLPPGLAISATTGLISGTIASGGVYPVALSAVNPSGTGTAALIITVNTSFKVLGGAYEGLVSIDGTNQGLLTMSLTAAGSFTGKLALPTVQYSLKGTFSPMGTYASIQAQGSAILNVFLYVNGALPGVSGSLTAETAVATTTYGLQCGLLRTYTAKTIPAGVAGYYTAIMPALSGTETSIPHAPGYGVMSVAATGAIHIDGKLPDGSLFNVRSQLHSDGQSWTFYTPLYGGKTPGTLAGTMTFEKENGSDTDGTLDWIKNPGNPGYYSGGLGLGINLLAAKYAAPVLTTTNGTLVFSSGNLIQGVTPIESSTDSLTISATDKVSVTAPGTTVTIAPSTGIFTGKFPYGGTELPFGGVFYIKPSAAGYGLFLGAGATGGVEITP